MINVGRLVNSPNFAQPSGFTVTRKTGAWVSGRFVASDEELTFSGSIQPLNTDELQQVPEGDRVTGAIKIYTQTALYTTKLDDTATGDDGQLSDEITWDGQQWKVINVENFSDYGYYKAIATRKPGA